MLKGFMVHSHSRSVVLARASSLSPIARTIRSSTAGSPRVSEGKRIGATRDNAIDKKKKA